MAYTVTARRIVDRRRARLPLAVDVPRLTLVTCYPFDALVPGGPLRYLVIAEALGTAGGPAELAAAGR